MTWAPAKNNTIFMMEDVNSYARNKDHIVLETGLSLVPTEARRETTRASRCATSPQWDARLHRTCRDKTFISQRTPPIRRRVESRYGGRVWYFHYAMVLMFLYFLVQRIPNTYGCFMGSRIFIVFNAIFIVVSQLYSTLKPVEGMVWLYKVRQCFVNTL